MKLPKICGGMLNVTQKCNLACKYCFVHQKPLEITYKTAKDAVDFFARNALDELRVPDINFFGGEPLIRYDDIVKPIIEYIRSSYGDYTIGITTNGTLLNEDKLKFFKKNDVGILLSVDGDKPTQDLLRTYHNGKGSFDDIPVELYLKYYPHGTLRATLDKKNVKYLYDNYLWGEKIGYDRATFIINAFETWDDEEINILKENLNKITDRIIEKKRNNEFYMEYTEIEKLENVYKLQNTCSDCYFRDDGQDKPACGTCGLGGNVYGSISTNGDIYSCQEMVDNNNCEEFIIGNIYTGVNDDKRIDLCNKFNTKNVACKNKKRCKNCELNKVCNGGCVINNYFTNNNLEIVSEIWCIYSELCFKNYKRIKEELI